MVSLIKETDFFICLVATDAATGVSSFTSSTGVSSFTSSTGVSSFTSSTGASSFGAGAHVVTMPPSVFEKMYNHVLTDKGLYLFDMDWAKVKR